MHSVLCNPSVCQKFQGCLRQGISATDYNLSKCCNLTPQQVLFMFMFRGSLLKVYISISSTMYGLFTKSILSTKIVTLNRPIANSSAQLLGL